MSVRRHEVGDKSGNELGDYMGNLTINPNEWKTGKVHVFEMNGREATRITANPTSSQPGNGFVKFGDETPCWNDLERSMDKNFPRRADNFQNQPLNESFNPKTKSGKALFLQTFEGARRVPQERDHLTREDVKLGIRMANEQGNPRKATGMFTSFPEKRHETYDNIRKASVNNYQSGSGEKGRGKCGSSGLGGGRRK